MTKSMVTRTQEQQEVINAKYNELCSALTAFDFQLREFTLLFDPMDRRHLPKDSGGA